MPHTLHPTDLGVLLVYLLAAAVLGAWVGRGARDLSAYLVGDRNLPWWAILGSIVATETSTATFLSVPGIAFAAGGDLRFLQLTMGYLLGRTAVVVVLLPFYFQGRIFSAYEVLAQRFGGWTKLTASLIFLVTRNLGDGLRLFLTAIALEKVADIPIWQCVVLIGIVTIAYTLAGGMKAVVWNDCVQFVVYIAGGLIAADVMISGLPDGVASFWQFAQDEQKLRWLDFRWDLGDPFTFWSAVVGGFFLTLGTHGTDQMMVQRYLSARSQTGAAFALVASAIVVALQFLMFLLIGVALAAFYNQHPPQTAFESGDHVFATFIVQELPQGRGVIGVVLAAVFAAAMSTLSSSINSSAAVAVHDVYLPWRRRHRTESPESHRLLRLTQAFTVAFGVLQITVGIAAQDVSRSVVNDALAIAGFSAGLLLGLFALGILTRGVGQKAATCGLLAGLTVLLALKFGWPYWSHGRPIWVAAPPVAWPWFPVVGSLVTFTFGLLTNRIGFDTTPGRFNDDALRHDRP